MLENYWLINKLIAKDLESVEGALLYSSIVELSTTSCSMGITDTEGNKWHKIGMQDLIKATTLSYRVHKRLLDLLVEKGYIKTKVMNAPASQYILILKPIQL